MPEGSKTGSCGIDVRAAVADPNKHSRLGAVMHRVRGEAVAGDLGICGAFFALSCSGVDASVGGVRNVVFRLALPEGHVRVRPVAMAEAPRPHRPAPDVPRCRP